MSVALDTRLRATTAAGTKFWSFAQSDFLQAFQDPYMVILNVPPGTIQPGRSDERTFVVDAANKLPYAQPLKERPEAQSARKQIGLEPARNLPGLQRSSRQDADGSRGFSRAPASPAASANA